MTFLSIGAFSRAIGVSQPVLRDWERKGWLLPHHRSPAGYRYYSEEQVNQYLHQDKRVFNMTPK